MSNIQGDSVLGNLVFSNSCAKDHPAYPTPMFKQGTDFWSLDDAVQQIPCDNPTDSEELMVYFACCDTTSKVCVDPVVTALTTIPPLTLPPLLLLPLVVAAM